MNKLIIKIGIIFNTIIVASLLNSCSYTKVIPFNSIDIKKCSDKEILQSTKEFPGIIIDSLSAIQSNDIITVSMNVRTYCEAQLTFKITEKDDRINMQLYNESRTIEKCTCTKKLSVTFKKVEPGFYNIIVTNYASTRLLGQIGFNIN